MYLLSVFLSIGTTVATFALSGKVDEVLLLFMAIDKGFEKTSGTNLTNLAICTSYLFRLRDTHKFNCLLYFLSFSSEGFLRNLFLNLLRI